ncbi:gp46 recombination endonuclease [Synechococcus phage S-RIM8 A.HR3]|uniref:Recombination-related endonuclease n=2 Tax=Neptunevirus srim18 TaxID=2734121 RepID=A0A1D7SBY9_9CAUD|nr:SbcC-like subunit of palindrome specific endonuclease [Synechococcus phage S-RIM8 A.HR1]YP_009783041.1 SbcC-like subunit of palindrome specific endonuclease [Synechococcus phage S-RIM8]AFB15402.1 gp46 recombination endonuclease subunit [Synechococcus phage S-RIM8 A.HR5]AFB17831.1 gp46 recombination endonuclease [Synechococcus phage S-RIM8 A.HR3]AGH57916.1 recombination endonuclease [Synechococcus phage KBS-M-1A]AFB17619.1 gp46 [Synechococcus phage S-RIM8 A.HR1]AOO11164.1 recombination-rela
MITFETIRWKNFLSTGDQWTEIDFCESPSTLIVGSNGAGKSTMLDALCFGLFGKAFRKINKPQLVNSINEKGLKVEVTFSIGKDDYRVFRGIKPNVFELYKNNKLIDQDAATKDTQKYLEQSVLKLNFKSFTQVVILGSSTFVPFMQLPAAHRREVIEDLLDINIFSNMNGLLKDRIRLAQGQSKDCQYMLQLSEEKVSSQVKLIESLQEVNDSRQEEKRKRHAENCEKMTGLVAQRLEKKAKLEKLEATVVKPEEQRKFVQKMRQEQADKKSELKIITKDLQFFKEHNVCPTCEQDIDADFKKDKVGTMTKVGKVLTKEISQFADDIEEAMKVIAEMDDNCAKLYELRSDYNTLDREIVRIEFENLQILDEISKLNDRPNIQDQEKELKVLQEQYEQTQSDCASVSQRLDEFQVVSSLLKDSGIKSQIIKKYIPIFNKLINKYLQSMDFFVNFTLDEEFNEVIKSRFRDEFSYASFSEGEKQKIDLALLFTWREVARMKNSVSTNLLILDEVFDSSLDASATGELLAILRGLGNGTNLFVISHKGDILVDKFLRTLRFEKVNDFSKMSDES